MSEAATRTCKSQEGRRTTSRMSANQGRSRPTISRCPSSDVGWSRPARRQDAHRMHRAWLSMSVPKRRGRADREDRRPLAQNCRRPAGIGRCCCCGCDCGGSCGGCCGCCCDRCCCCCQWPRLRPASPRKNDTILPPRQIESGKESRIGARCASERP